VSTALTSAGLGAAYTALVHDDQFDGRLMADTRVALSRTGPDVGTPIITFDPDAPEASSCFGPVTNRVPLGHESPALFDATATLARLGGFAELKCSARGDFVFPD